MTPSDRAMALVLRAWVDWPGQAGDVPSDLVLLEIGDTLRCAGLVQGSIYGNDPTPEGQALLDALEQIEECERGSARSQ